MTESTVITAVALLQKIFFSAIFLWLLLDGVAASAADLRPQEIVTVLLKDAIPLNGAEFGPEGFPKKKR